MSEPRSRWLYVLGMVVLSVLALVLVASLVMRILAPPAIPNVPISSVETDSLGVMSEKISIQVVNAAGVPGAARAVREHLVRRGFDVVATDNRPSANVEETYVVSRTGSLQEARWVARALNLPLDRATEEPQPELYVHVTVMVGLDYESFLGE